MKKHLLAFAVAALAAGGALAQAHDTIAKVKASGVITMGVRDSSGGLSYTMGDGKYGGFHVEICQRIIASLEKADRQEARGQVPARDLAEPHPAGAERHRGHRVRLHHQQRHPRRRT